MHIGIDISQIVYKGTGVARFTEGLVRAILEHDKQNRWTFFFSSWNQTLDDQLIGLIKEHGHTLIQVSIPPSVLTFLHNEVHYGMQRFTFNVSRFALDWFITSDWTEPSLPCKKATIVHDLVFKRYPETVHPTILHTQEKRLKWVAKESTLIFADSKATAEDLKQFYHIADEKIVMNYPGVARNAAISKDLYDLAKLRERFGLSDKYILTVGKLEPRKNIQRLIEAFSTLQTDYQLVIIGPQGWGEIPQSPDPRVIFPGYVSDDELHSLYLYATAFVYPSLYEGFGYPVIEAMQYGCPVVTSNTSSLAEIATDAALLCDPHDANSIARAIEQMLASEQLRNELAIKGKSKAETFSWERYYNTLITNLTQNV